MSGIASGVHEIRIRDRGGAFCILYVAKLAKSVVVLHCFQKKTQKTAKSDLELAAKRYQDCLRHRLKEQP